MEQEYNIEYGESYPGFNMYVDYESIKKFVEIAFSRWIKKEQRYAYTIKVNELLKKYMEEALRKEDPVKKTEGEKQTIAENETTEEAEIMLDASKDEKTSDISDDEFDLDREISELEEELPML